MNAVRTHYLDASAIVKLYADEDGSDITRRYVDAQSTLYTTNLCVVEVLSVLKRKAKRSGTANGMSNEDYMKACEEFLTDLNGGRINVDDIEIATPAVYGEVERLMVRNNLYDLSDAFQLYALKKGFFATMAGESKTILITADEELARTARKEKLRVWDCLRESAP